MATKTELKRAFWELLEKERTVMLACTGVYPRPMTAMVENGRGPVWFFTSKESDLVRDLGGRSRAAIQFAAKDHQLFAALDGELIADNDRAMIDELWNPFVAAWFEGGKDDPKLQLLRFEPSSGRVWENDNSLFAGVKLLLGRDPKKAYEAKVGDIRPN